jgi:multiple sugar transport system permease protein
MSATDFQLRIPGRRARRRGDVRPGSSALAPLALCFPFFAFFALFVIVPVVYAIVLSTKAIHRSGLGLTPPTSRFVGLHNYVTALGDGTLGAGLVRVLEYFLVQSTSMLVLATVIALLLDRTRSRVGNAIVRTVCFLPFSMPLVVGSVMWSFLYEPELSPIVRVVRSAGLAGFNPLSPHLIFWGLTNILTWEWTGYNVIILVTALQAVPPEVIEAARMDGASEWKLATLIKLPLLRPALVMATLFSMIGVLQMFGEPETISAITSSISSDYTPNMYVYTTAFTGDLVNYASAVAVVLAVLTGILSFVALRATRRISAV